MPRRDEEKPKQKYTFAPEVERVARELIEEHHTHLSERQGVKILYLFCEEPEKVRGSEALGTARKIGGMNGFLVGYFAQAAGGTTLTDRLLSEWGQWDGEHGEFFVITIYRRAWQFSLSEKQRIALVDHELCHCGTKDDKDGNMRLVLCPHDTEEFISVIHRHGPWSADVAAIIKAAKLCPQLTFEQIAERDVDTDSSAPGKAA